MIRIYGKKGCRDCDEMKAWLTEKGVPFEFYDVVDFGERWREAGVVEAMVESSYFNGVLPILRLPSGRYCGTLDAKKRIERELSRKET